MGSKHEDNPGDTKKDERTPKGSGASKPRLGERELTSDHPSKETAEANELCNGLQNLTLKDKGRTSSHDEHQGMKEVTKGLEDVIQGDNQLCDCPFVREEMVGRNIGAIASPPPLQPSQHGFQYGAQANLPYGVSNSGSFDPRYSMVGQLPRTGQQPQNYGRVGVMYDGHPHTNSCNPFRQPTAVAPNPNPIPHNSFSPGAPNAVRMAILKKFASPNIPPCFTTSVPGQNENIGPPELHHFGPQEATGISSRSNPFKFGDGAATTLTQGVANSGRFDPRHPMVGQLPENYSGVGNRRSEQVDLLDIPSEIITDICGGESVFDQDDLLECFGITCVDMNDYSEVTGLRNDLLNAVRNKDQNSFEVYLSLCIDNDIIRYRTLNGVDVEGHTLLSYALSHQWDWGLQRLIQAGADLQVRHLAANTIFHLAAHMDDTKWLQNLIDWSPFASEDTSIILLMENFYGKTCLDILEMRGINSQRFLIKE